jgi:hypothetical protein
MTRRAAVILASWAAGAALGCAPGEIYEHGRRFAPGTVTARSRWRLSGEVDGAAAAVDNDVTTAAVAAAPYQNATLTIDLGELSTFNMVTVDHGRDDQGFARRVELLTSTDGKRYVRQAVVAGTRRVTTICLVTPQAARYVRLRATGDGRRAWSVAEVYIQ